MMLAEGFMFISLLRKRRSIRRYSQVEVETEKLDTLVEAALRAPSSRRLDPWEFIVVLPWGIRTNKSPGAQKKAWRLERSI